MTIRCSTLTEFLDVIAGLVERGMGFRADSSSLPLVLNTIERITQ